MRTVLGKRLLIVEDDVDSLEGLQAWAADLGCEARVARSGRQALELTRVFRPRVLIADYLLEDDVTGLDVIVQLRALSPSATCVLITGVLQEALRESLNRIDGVLILAKPVNFDRLRRIVFTAR
jgi:DNA-binding NtrC family response regulator